MSHVVNLEGQEIAKFDWPEQVNGHLIRLQKQIDNLEIIIGSLIGRIDKLGHKCWWEKWLRLG